MINKAIVVGHLGRDPELRYTQSGTAVATLNLATNRRRRDQEGNYIDETEWHRIVAWSKTAEFCGNYLKKGALLYVEGRLQTRKWTDQNGVDRYTTEIVAENLQSLTPKGGQGAGSSLNEPPPLEDADYSGYGGSSGGYGSGYGGDSYSGGNSGSGNDFFGSNSGGSGGDAGSSDTSSDFGDSFKGEGDSGGFGGDDGTGDDTPF